MTIKKHPDNVEIINGKKFAFIATDIAYTPSNEKLLRIVICHWWLITFFLHFFKPVREFSVMYK